MIWLKILLVLTVTLLETTSQFGEECECGVRKSGGASLCSRSGRVAGGDEADVGEFPWMALLVIRSTGKNTKRCGGTLINSRFVLTTAHCALYSHDIEVILGGHNLRSRGNEFRVKVNAPIIHNRYEKGSGYVAFNFALLELPMAIDFDSYPLIRPVCLPDNIYRDYDGEGGVVAGWGNTHVEYTVRGSLVQGGSSQPANVLQKLSIRLVSQKTCKNMFQTINTKYKILEDNLCASSAQGDSCTGDSGGGLVMTSCPGGYDELVGVISFGIGCNSTYDRDTIPGVYSRVSSVVNWIKRETANGKFCKKPNKRLLFIQTSNRKARCQCGIKPQAKVRINPKITGGEEAYKNEFPWAAFIRITKNGKHTSCGGTLINDRYVLTAGHCVPTSNLEIEVTLGEHDITQRENELKLTATYKRHTGYAFNALQGFLVNDFALLRLSRKVDFTSYPHIRPICLPDPGFEDYDYALATVTGWGNTKVGFQNLGDLVKGYGSAVSDTLQKLDMRFVRQDTCDDIYYDLKIQIRDSNLCARSIKGDACKGDSGGGLVMKNGGNQELMGVVSFGVGCNSTYKGESLPGLYGRVSLVIDWIRQETQDGQFCGKK